MAAATALSTASTALAAGVPLSSKASNVPRGTAFARFPKVSTVSSRRQGLRVRASGPTTPPELSNKVSESIKKAEETCASDPTSGECVAAWDEVEELSAAASHKRDAIKATDPLEEYCKDNPETDECRTYED